MGLLCCLFLLWTLNVFIIRAKVMRTLFLLLNHKIAQNTNSGDNKGKNKDE